MIDRTCISINNCCNLKCSYCHFHDPSKSKYLQEADMDIFKILDNIMDHIEKYNIEKFKLGFVGNGEPLLVFDELCEYIRHIESYLENGKISAYTITNGTLLSENKLVFFKEHNINVGISIDGIPEIHNKYRCNSHDKVMQAINLYYKINNCFPPMNCTVSRDVLDKADETIDFFKTFHSRITFSRMIGREGISLKDFHQFLEKAKIKLNIRTGGYDCTMYGGLCGAGINNVFFSNGKIYLCGNCVDIPTIYTSNTPLDELDFKIESFNRNGCYKELLNNRNRYLLINR